MARYAAFLRGMNLGNRRITNSDLRAACEGLGFEDVATFRASGNVIFEAPRASDAKLASRFEDGLAQTLGYAVPTFIRSSAEVNTIAAFEPFDAAEVKASGGKLQVSLLGSKPSAAKSKRVLALATDDDRLAIEGRELYWLPSGGILRSELDLDAIDAELGPSTRRTMGTIELIAAKHFSDE